MNRDAESFLRRVIHSDGCRVIASDRGVKSVRYHFSNRSEDIKRLFCNSLDISAFDGLGHRTDRSPSTARMRLRGSTSSSDESDRELWLGFGARPGPGARTPRPGEAHSPRCDGYVWASGTVNGRGDWQVVANPPELASMDSIVLGSLPSIFSADTWAGGVSRRMARGRDGHFANPWRTSLRSLRYGQREASERLPGLRSLACLSAFLPPRRIARTGQRRLETGYSVRAVSYRSVNVPSASTSAFDGVGLSAPS